MPSSRFALREARPGDLREIASLEAVCFPDPWGLGALERQLTSPMGYNVVTVLPDGRIVGYLLALWQYLDLHVLRVGTLPSFRRLGVAESMLKAVLGHAARCGGETVTLEVAPSNVGAISLYRKLGFQVVGRRRSYYAEGRDALLMTLVITEGEEREEVG